jgi:hypothetical protein
MFWMACISTSAFAANDETQANSYDNAWAASWVAHCRSIYTSGSGKTAGFVLEVGDSITHANPYAQWPRYGSGKTAADTTLCNWCSASSWNTGSNTDTSNKNGWYLAAADTTGQRGMTASGGISTDEYLSGNNNGGPAMPADTSGTAPTTLTNTTYTGNIQIDTLIASFKDAQFVVLMLGTNDMKHSRSVSAFTTDLTTIVNKFEAQNIVVVVSTIPPNSTYDATGFNAAIANLAQTHGLPLIDFYSEILVRQPGTAWLGTLIDSADGTHPTAGVNGYNAASDPYSPGGDATSNRTGDACLNSGYLLRSWLTVQKLKQVKSYVVDGVNPLTLTTITVAPASAVVLAGGTKSFSAIGYDQFGAPMNPQPTFTWLVSSGGVINSAGVFTAGSTGGTYSVTAKSGAASGSASVQVSLPPVINSPPTGSVTPIVAGQSVTFNVQATDPQGGLLTYSWNFGDSTSASGSVAAHTFATPGVYTVTVTITDPNGGSTSSSITATVIAPASGTGGNGGSGSGTGGANNGGSGTGTGSSGGNGGGALPVTPMTVSKLQGSSTFNQSGRDACAFAGILPGLPAGFDPTNLAVTVNVSGAIVNFTLDSKGRAKTNQGSLQLTIKGKRDKTTKKINFAGGDVPIKGSLTHGTWSTVWGFDANSAPAAIQNFTVSIEINGTLFGATVTCSMTSKPEKGAKFKK